MLLLNATHCPACFGFLFVMKRNADNVEPTKTGIRPTIHNNLLNNRAPRLHGHTVVDFTIVARLINSAPNWACPIGRGYSSWAVVYCLTLES